MFSGSCLCGGIAFEIYGELAPIQICHCVQCRKAQGSAFASNIPVAIADFRLVQGDDLLAVFASSTGKERFFCRRCGSPIYSKKARVANVLRVRAGLINEPLPVAIAAHAFVVSKANWWPINDALPQFSAFIAT